MTRCQSAYDWAVIRIGHRLTAHELDPAFVGDEVNRTSPVALALTINRSVVGTMSEFTFLAEHTRTDNLVEQAVLLGRTPCSPLCKRHVSPDRELRALVAEHSR